MSMKKEMKVLRKALKGMDFEMISRRKHEKWQHDNGGILIVPLSPSCPRAQKNLMSTARKIAAGHK